MPKCPYIIDRPANGICRPYQLIGDKLGPEDDELAPVVEVRKFWHEGVTHHFKSCYKDDAGNVHELWTEEEYNRRYNAVRANEGEEHAKYVWAREKVNGDNDRFSTHVASKTFHDARWHAYEQCQVIIQHFEMVVNLGLVELSVTF